MVVKSWGMIAGQQVGATAVRRSDWTYAGDLELLARAESSGNCVMNLICSIATPQATSLRSAGLVRIDTKIATSSDRSPIGKVAFSCKETHGAAAELAHRWNNFLKC
jgi:hypothetical protein